jgi:hypothetical protein
MDLKNLSLPSAAGSCPKEGRVNDNNITNNSFFI